MASWRDGTSEQYHTYLKRWRQYCDDKDIDLFQPGVHNGVEFLVSLYKAGLGYSAVNTVRSAPGGVRTTIAKHHGWYSKSDHLCQDGVE